MSQANIVPGLDRLCKTCFRRLECALGKYKPRVEPAVKSGDVTVYACSDFFPAAVARAKAFVPIVAPRKGERLPEPASMRSDSNAKESGV